MKFKMPESLDGLSLKEIADLHAKALAEATELNAIADEKITDDESAALIELVGHVGTLSDRKEELETEAAAKAQQLADARGKLAASEEDGGDEDEEEESDEDADTEDADAEDKVEKKEPVLASGKKTFASKAAAKSPGKTSDEKLADDLSERSGALSIVAAANIPGFNSGQTIEDFNQLADAYAQRAKTFASGSRAGRRGMKSLADSTYGGTELTSSAQRYAVARLEKPANEFTITEKMSAEDQYDLIMRASSEKRLGKSLVAAGGWCSPSEQIYGFLELESADGLLSIPEIAARRGGIQFTKGPQLGDLLLEADLGWTMTEAQAEAGTFTKPIFDIECPDWDEVRMEAVGYALRAGLLTDATYPELLRRYLSLAMIVHARRMNATTIQRISTLIGAATTFASVGTTPSVTADLLSAIELNALRIREQFSMPLGATVEAIFPLWVKSIVRSDLSRRTGVENMLSVTDQQIEAWFSQRQISAQFVRDYQGINAGAATTAGGTGTWTRWPDKVEFMLYPAGSFVRLATDVIDLDTVYDTDNLTKNQFLAAFFEEGFAVANTGGAGVKVVVNLPNLYGSTGFPAVGAGAGVTFATV
ncbi:major capsid hexamer protein [Microbacterium phage Kelcole]|nr:major capsid hexamer protein [Microbacterium phage Kelcole]